MDNNQIASNEATELRNCVNDFEHFCENYVKINHPIKGLVSFKLYDYQKRYIKCLQENQYVIAKKFRQGGFTTLTTVYMLWVSLFRTDKRLIYLSRTDREACYMGAMIGEIVKSLPAFLRGATSKMNDHTIEFVGSGSVLNFFTLEPACGKRADIVFIDEPAFIGNMENAWNAIRPIISPDGKCFAVSTPNTTGDWFGKTYQNAIRKKNNFVIFTANYKEHPDYSDLEWTEKTKASLGPKLWRKEVLAEFVIDFENKKNTWGPGVEFLCDITPEQEKHFLIQASNQLKIKLAEEKVKENQNKKNEIIKDVAGKEIAVRVSKDLQLGHWEGEGKINYPDVVDDCSVDIRDQHSKVGSSGVCDDSTSICQTSQEIFHKKDVMNECNWSCNWPHPNFNKDIMQTKEEFADMLDALGCSEFKESMRNSEKQINQKIKNIDDETEPQELFLAGLIDSQELTKIEKSRPDREIIDKIMNCGELQDGLKLAFKENKLCVNDVPTWMKESDLRDAYNGLCGLTSHEETVNHLAELIKNRLKPLFRKE